MPSQPVDAFIAVAEGGEGIPAGSQRVALDTGDLGDLVRGEAQRTVITRFFEDNFESDDCVAPLGPF